MFQIKNLKIKIKNFGVEIFREKFQRYILFLNFDF